LRIPKHATDEDIIAAVGSWNDLMAAGNWEAARAVLPDDEMDADAFRRAVDDQCEWAGRWFQGPAGGLPYRITRFAEARLHPSDDVPNPTNQFSHWDVYRREDGAPYHVVCSLPLNGYWSALSAMFELTPDGDQLILSLVNLRVM
jgi:hypothetical protein